MTQAASVPVALSIAGSDPSGGAGIQADLKTFQALGVYGVSVVTALTAQTTARVSKIFDPGPEAVAAQLDAVMEEVRPAAVKIGMLMSARNVATVAAKLRESEVGPVVLDPVLTASTGVSLLEADALATLRELLLPLADVLTPNIPEAEALLGAPVRTLEEMQTAARALRAMGPSSVLVKGGHLPSRTAPDVFYDGSTLRVLEGKRIEGADSHGSGCVLSAALAAHLALGATMEDALGRSKTFTEGAIRARLRPGRAGEVSNPGWNIATGGL